MAVRTTTFASWQGSTSNSQLVCDSCGSATETVMHGHAVGQKHAALQYLRVATGFTEVGRGEWRGPTAPQGIAERPIKDICAKCRQPKEES
jgi:hypothetical protein